MVHTNEIPRRLKLDLADARAAFLWGPRKVGKTTLLRQQFKEAHTYDLLDSDLRTRLLLRPALLKEEVLAQKPSLVVIDEVQKVPALLDEVHWCLENTRTKFVMCGSSARKLRREAANLLGGRAWRFELFGLTTAEIGTTDLDRILNHGLVPRHFLEAKPERSLRGYVLDYLEQEIHAEALVRHLPTFALFLDAVALAHGQLLNYATVARDCGVSPKTVREYYQILEDTLLGHTLPPWRKAKKRRLIETAKFYLFDPGTVRALTGMRRIEPRSDEHGRAFEHFLIEEVRAYLAYEEKHLPMAYWRTSTGQEVDLIVGALDLAIEFKATAQVNERHIKGLMALMEDQKVKRALIVSLDKSRRRLKPDIEVLPWQDFCAMLWAGELL
ncbi:MAG: AAA family ATPase [Deltaproteobacteria bacterium RIFOXYA12_FULL_58_15]|nr:MAG: AAA family ATPase [Deltaproteobacteria bacterium RIFOXYA12_FULL_58_15]OGR08412.1 MAG: AAA family ATPase [Deltaproteobacteria bacterium RIFOXYB12_FULL_58_9]